MAKNHSRTTNTILNFTSSIGGQILTIFVQFLTRTVFIATLGKSYLGINGLFSNILSMLSLAEFGVGSAILFKLYKPIAEENYRRIAILMKFYRTVYRIIGMAVAIIGICLIPFLPVLINDYSKLQNLGINAPLIYCLFLFKSVSTYLFFAYKSAIIKANQKEYYVNIISYLFTIGTSFVQILFLYLVKSFTIYVFIMVIQVIGQNIICAIISDKLYPYIKESTSEKVSKEEAWGVIKDCSAIFLYKLNGVVLNATDNIIIAKFIGLNAVGEYSNYYILYTTINSLFAKIYNSVSHSLGNLHTGENRKHEYLIFEAVMLITAILGGTACIGIFVCADELILAWIGSEWLIKQPFGLLMGLELYTLAFRIALSKYRTSMGLFQQAKYRPLAGMIINLVVSVGLVHYWGIYGVLVGTIVADWTTMMWFDPIIIHKYGFDGIIQAKRYFIKFGRNFVAVILVGMMDYFVCSHLVVGYSWISVIIHAVVCGITVPSALIVLNINSDEGKYVYKIGMRYIKRIRKKIRL